LLLKNFINTNPNGHYIWIGSIVSETPRPFHSIYGCTKLASTFATNLIAQEAENMKITEVRLGVTATNIRHTNYNGSKTKQQVDKEYINDNAMSADYAATRIIDGVLQNKLMIEIND
jgi:short-subunit dehydrogenase